MAKVLWEKMTRTVHKRVVAWELSLQRSSRRNQMKYVKRPGKIVSSPAVAMQVNIVNKYINKMVFDTDSAKVGIDNRCSACMSHAIEDFEGPLV